MEGIAHVKARRGPDYIDLLCDRERAMPLGNAGVDRHAQWQREGQFADLSSEHVKCVGQTLRTD